MSDAGYKIAVDKLTCYHCGEDCKEDKLIFDEKNFCCNGCKTVYEILKNNNLCNYYDLNNTPGASLKNKFHAAKFQYLDEEDVVRKIVKFDNGILQKVVFQIPYIHCSSCIYLLEKLPFISPAIKSAQVNFLKKTIAVTYASNETSLRKVVELLANIGYEPSISLNDIENEIIETDNKQYYLRLGVAFFCFGNVMLLSFPEYLGIDFLQEATMRKFFGYINLLLGLPLLFYSASPFFSSAYHALKQKTLNMDVPIVLGMIVMYLRSLYDVFIAHGGGYIDTLASLTFLMLVGRLFQNKTYDILRFDRDFKSYFPVSVTIFYNKKEEKTVALNKLKVGDTILIRNQELIPADAILISEEAAIDYSFVTGEAVPVAQKKDDRIFAGGKNMGHNIQLVVEKNVSHSYLTQLWNDQSFKKDEQKKITTLSLAVSRWFTPIILLIAGVAFAYWALQHDMAKAINAATSILIITCPCALALSSPFTLGNILRLLGRAEMYLKNNISVEMLASIDTIVFDKTGTLSSTAMTGVQIEISVSEVDLQAINSITKNSTHPLSRKIATYLKDKDDIAITGFEEIEGKGILATVGSDNYKIGAKKWLEINDEIAGTLLDSYVYVTKNGVYLTRIAVKNEYRNGIENLLSLLKQNYDVYVLSGDNDYAKNYLSKFIDAAHLHFYQTPQNKLSFIQSLQQNGKKVMMIGDGLNDAGALKSSDMGIAIADDLNNFSPACDAIIKGDRLVDLPQLLSLAKTGVKIIKISFFASFIYNFIGIYFAAQGTMTPIVAAILMPISSVSIIAFTTLSTIWFFNRKFPKNS